MIGDEDGARARGQAAQHLEVTRLDPEPIAPGQVESVEDLGRPDHHIRATWPAGKRVGSDMIFIDLRRRVPCALPG